MSQLTGIKPLRTLGQCVGDLLNRPAYSRPAERVMPERATNTGKRGASFTGISGIAKKGQMFTVTMNVDGKRKHVGCYVNLRTAVQVLSDARNFQPWNLPGMSRPVWDMLVARYDYLPFKKARNT